MSFTLGVGRAVSIIGDPSSTRNLFDDDPPGCKVYPMTRLDPAVLAGR